MRTGEVIAYEVEEDATDTFLAPGKDDKSDWADTGGGGDADDCGLLAMLNGGDDEPTAWVRDVLGEDGLDGGELQPLAGLDDGAGAQPDTRLAAVTELEQATAVRLEPPGDVPVGSEKGLEAEYAPDPVAVAVLCPLLLVAACMFSWRILRSATWRFWKCCKEWNDGEVGGEERFGGLNRRLHTLKSSSSSSDPDPAVERGCRQEDRRAGSSLD